MSALLELAPLSLAQQLDDAVCGFIWKLGDPDEVLTHAEHGPYLEKWHLRRHDDGSATLLHRFLRSDADDEMHDHPWDNRTFVLAGGYWDVSENGRTWLRPGDMAVRLAGQFHRVELEPGIIPVTLFTHGPKINEWGFQLSDGRKVGWREFTANSGAYRTSAALRSRAAMSPHKDEQRSE